MFFKFYGVTHDVVERVISNFLIWSNPEESVVGLLNLGSTYGSPVTTVVPALRGNNLSLLEHLHQKRRSKIVKRGSSSATKPNHSYHVDARSESEARRDSTIPDSSVKSTGVTRLSSKSHRGKPPPVPLYLLSKGASSATSVEFTKRKVIRSDSLAIGGVFLRSSP